LFHPIKGHLPKAVDTRGAGKSSNTIKGEPATVFGYPGNYIIVNDRTGAIIQVSGRNDPEWDDDSRIKWNTNP
jgi:Colicin E5 ribonuclease domain